MKHASLFSGIGGFDLAAQWIGWENVLHCEIDPFPRQVLKYYWPNAISYTDIITTDFTPHYGTVDIISGGFPCQPFSLAGKRQGTADSRHLWPEMLRAIREIAPRWVIGENVYGIVNWSKGLVFEQVQADLESAGYEVWPLLLPACGINAPHRRDRFWFVAYNNRSRLPKQWGDCNRQIQNKSQRPNLSQQTFGLSNQRPFANPQSRWPRGLPNKSQKAGPSKGNKPLAGFCGVQPTTNTSQLAAQRSRADRQQKPSTYARQRLPVCSSAATNWANWPTQSPVCSGDDGLPTQLDKITFSSWRNKSIKGYGNAIVPQVALQIFKAIEEFEKLKNQ